MGDNFSRSSQ